MQRLHFLQVLLEPLPGLVVKSLPNEDLGAYFLLILDENKNSLVCDYCD